MSLVNDDAALRIREKHAKKQEQVKVVREEFKEAVASGEKLLACERTANGLYYVYFKNGGQLTEELKGRFTSMHKLRSTVINRYGKDIIA
jgi:hypothetical protein